MMKYPIQNDYLHSNKARFVHPLASYYGRTEVAGGRLPVLPQGRGAGRADPQPTAGYFADGAVQVFRGAFHHCREVSDRLRAARCEVVD